MSEERRVLIVESRFYPDIADELLKGAVAVLDEAGVSYHTLAVPGVFEVPAAIRIAIRAMEIHSATTDHVGFVALGTVIRGETDHYEHISREATRALMDITVQHPMALGFGVLTCDTAKQARERAAIGQGNKGAGAARACLRMMELKKELRFAPR
jgi:6,7-dimethyl-8-ribityllumazine synthase